MRSTIWVTQEAELAVDAANAAASDFNLAGRGSTTTRKTKPCLRARACRDVEPQGALGFWGFWVCRWHVSPDFHRHRLSLRSWASAAKVSVRALARPKA